MTDTDANAVASPSVRLADIRTETGRAVGVEVGGGVLDIGATAGALGLPVPADMDDLLQDGCSADLAAVLDRTGPDFRIVLPIDVVTITPLVTWSEKIICVGTNDWDRASETGPSIPKVSPHFSNYRNPPDPHGGGVALPTGIDDRFDFETELAVVIGRDAKGVADTGALDVVVGYTVGNCLSSRREQAATTLLGAGDWSDGLAPLGPWLPPAALVSYPNVLELTTRINGECGQNWATAEMDLDRWKLIAYRSGTMTRRPGDVFYTCTPHSVTFEESPPERRSWCRAGDRIVSATDGLGEFAVTLA